jgi:hypothetical protein
MRVMVLSGLTWSAAWLVTSWIFFRLPQKEATEAG